MRWTCKDCNRVVDELSATPFCPHCRAEQTFNIYAGKARPRRYGVLLFVVAVALIYFLR